ncbi:hypothetical protein OUZ56_009814 [Daphnia magna]|uniref:Uncharacterized protein n=1 Tax=Daphnia magna TaxID=35525 RepID=A0ABR0AGY9_9CRUS|nr:hypothetical protein OUZ56_009814 [Daphnia magna]
MFYLYPKEVLSDVLRMSDGIFPAGHGHLAWRLGSLTDVRRISPLSMLDKLRMSVGPICAMGDISHTFSTVTPEEEVERGLKSDFMIFFECKLSLITFFVSERESDARTLYRHELPSQNSKRSETNYQLVLPLRYLVLKELHVVPMGIH